MDRHRSAVYAAEDHLRRLLADGGVVDFHGSVIDVPAERRFGDLAGAQRYLDAVRSTDWGHPGTPAPVVVRRRGPRKATWTAPNIIAVPDGQQWAMRETVLLHEYAHHVTFHTGGGADHDRRFCVVLLGLIGAAMSPSVELLLRAAFTDAGIFTTRGIDGSRRGTPSVPLP